VFCPDLGIVADAKLALEALIAEARGRRLPKREAWAGAVQERKRTMLRRTDFDNTPIKPQRAFQEINAAFGRDTRFVTAIGLYQIASGQFQKVYKPRNYIICGQAGPLGWEVSACTGAKLADPSAEVVGIVGDYSLQFLIEELAVAAQYRIPFVLVVLNNAYLGLIRQAERGYNMDYEVQLSFQNINAPEIGDYGVDHVKAAEAFGCIARRVFDPAEIAEALQWARTRSTQASLPVVLEIITERVTNIAMGPEIDKVTEFEEIVDLAPAPAREPETV
jgi:tartronate-semialdehyde synthase